MKNIYTEEYLFSCLACCEAVISKNMYLNKVWEHSIAKNDTYKIKAEQWMEYRTTIRSLLFGRYTMREIIQHSKSCQKKATQKAVKDLVVLIHDGKYKLE